MTATGSRTTKIFAVLACVEIAASGLGAVFMEWAYAVLSRAHNPKVPPSTTVFLAEILGFGVVMAVLGALALVAGVNTTTTGNGNVILKRGKMRRGSNKIDPMKFPTIYVGRTDKQDGEVELGTDQGTVSCLRATDGGEDGM